MSEIVSDDLHPVVGTYVGGREIISCEDLLAREESRRWSKKSF